MIHAVFTVKDNVIRGFTVSGHADYSEEGSDIVCAAVSSAAYMAANTVTEVQSIEADVTVSEGYLQVELSEQDAKAAEVILSGFLLHLNALCEQFQDYISVKISEV